MEEPEAAGAGGRPPLRLTGGFTARLTVNGKTYTQPFLVRPDPRRVTQPS